MFPTNEKSKTQSTSSTSTSSSKSKTSKQKSKPKPKPKPKIKVKPKPKPKPRPKKAKPAGWFKRNVRTFKKKLKKFGGDYMTMLARMKPAGEPEVKQDDIPYVGCYIKSLNQLGQVTL